MSYPKGWFEGTLDVISGIAPRSSTPTPQARNNGSTSAPNSPGPGMIRRMPSQDSLDRSLHNDSSGHGNKSTAQIIRDLKQSNARLSEKTCALEADFMNQLNELSKKYEDKQQKYEEEILKAEKLTTSLERRSALLETKLKEKEESLQRLREESAFQRHTISDLRTQLDWAENADKGAEWEVEKDQVLRELRLTQEQVKAEIKDKEKLREQLLALQSGEGGADLAESLRHTQAALERVRQEGQKQQAEHEKEVTFYKDQLDKAQQTVTMETTEKEEKADAATLAQELLESQNALESLRKELEKVKAQSAHQEQYRQEEADDLRLLNDAQEEELQRLRSDLDEAVKELEQRDRELEERNEELRAQMEKAEFDTPTADTSDTEIQRISKELQETKISKDFEIKRLSGRVKELQQESDKLRSTIGQNEELIAELRQTVEEVQSQLAEAQRKPDHEAKLLATESELNKLQKNLTDALKQKEEDKTFIASLKKELNESQAETLEVQRKLDKALTDSRQQSGGEYEEDLRKEVANLRQTRKELRAKIEALEDETEANTASMKGKLADRDTTISALVKSNVSLESELSSARIELQLCKARLSKSQDSDDGEEGVDVILARTEELAELRDSLAAYKETESRLSVEVSRLEKQLSELKWENIRLRRQKSDSMHDDNASASGSVISRMGSNQIKEQDEAIARLVKQTVSQEKKIKVLQKQVERMSAGGGSPSRVSRNLSASEKEIEQLRQESEMFAGQVIELDEEIDRLRRDIEERDLKLKRLSEENEDLRNIKPLDLELEREKDDKIAALLSELNDLKSRPMADGDELDRIRKLEAEVDELQEANAEQMIEIRSLRRGARDSRAAADDIAKANARYAEAETKLEDLRKVVDSLTEQNEILKRESQGGSSVELETKLELLNKTISERDQEIRELKALVATSTTPTPSGVSQNGQLDEFESQTMREEIQRLRTTMANQSEDLENAKETILELEKMVAEKNEDAMAHWQDEKEELMADIEELTKQLEAARSELSSLEKERSLIEDFKFKLEQADEEREKSEKSIVDNFERRIKLLTLDKDVTIDKLRKELVAAKEGSTANVDELQAEIEMYKAKLEEIEEEAAAEIDQRDNRIFVLENTLDASKQLVSNMRTEMDHLQGSMEHAVADRKEEIEDMQQELVDLTATIAQKDRELGGMRMKLEEKHLAYEAEVSKLQELIGRLEREKANFKSNQNAHDMQMDLRMREVQERLEKMKWRNQSLQDENESLRQRLSKLESHSKTDYVDREKYEKLYTEYSEKKNQLADLQMELEEARAVIVTPAPTLPPGSAEKKKSSKRIGFLGRRKGGNNMDEVAKN